MRFHFMVERESYSGPKRASVNWEFVGGSVTNLATYFMVLNITSMVESYSITDKLAKWFKTKKL